MNKSPSQNWSQMVLSLSKEVIIYQVNMKQSREDISFQTFLDSFLYLVHLKENYGNSWNVLYIVAELGKGTPPPAGQNWIPVSTALRWKAAAEKTDLCKRLLAHSTATALGSCPEVLLHQRRWAVRYRETGILHCTESCHSPAQHSEQWPCLWSRKQGAMRPNCSTHATDSSIF